MTHNNRKKAKKYKKDGLPPYVVIKEGAWHVRLNFATRQRDAKGRIVYDQITRKCEPETAARAAEIVEWLRAEYERVKAGTPTPGRTLGEFLEYYLSVKSGNVTRRTHEFYTDLFDRHIKSHEIGRTPLAELKTIGLQEYFTKLSASPARKQKLRILLNMAMKQAVAWEMLPKNPLAGVILPKVRAQESIAMTQAEARAFLAACRTDDRFIIFELALETGLRPQECIGLRWSDIDLSRRRLSVRQAIAQGFQSGGYEIKEPKTGSSVRSVGFSQELKERLLAHKANQDAWLAEMRADAGKPLQTQKRVQGINYQIRKNHRKRLRIVLTNQARLDLVFPADNGLPRSLNNLNRRDFKEVLELAGIDPRKYSFKVLRHTNASLLAETLHPKKLQKRLGHSRLETSLKFYVHVNDESEFEGSDAMVEALY